MTGTRPAEILRHLEPDATTDGELLERFLRRDENAFAVLVRRHGAVVLATCRRITNHAQDAEDAFQAVFLILAKKAAAIRDSRLLGNWLYGVAVRVSQKARRAAARRRTREVQVVNVPEPFVLPDEANAEYGAALHEELAKLPAHYRDAIVLCDLRGASRTDAARTLGIPEGTLSSRLASGRKKLAERLVRRGVALSAASVPMVLAEGASAAVTDSLVEKLCCLLAGWQAGAMVPASVLRLTRGGFSMRKMMLLGAFGLALSAIGVAFASKPNDEPPQQADPPKAETTVAKAAPAVAPAEEPKKEVIAERFDAPRIRKAFDTRLTHVEDAVWSPDGGSLAVSGVDEGRPGIGRQDIVTVFPMRDRGVPEPTFRTFVREPNVELVGFTPDSNRVITELREYHLVSGFHELTYWEPTKDNPEAMAPAGGVKLQPERTHSFAFAPDGKTYRTVVSERKSIPVMGKPAPGSPVPANGHDDERSVISKLMVREVNAESGRTIRTLKTIEGEFDSFQLSGDGKRLAVGQTDGVAIHDMASGKKVFCPLKPQPRKERNGPRPMGAAPMGGPEPAEDERPGTLAVVISSKGNVVLVTRDAIDPVFVDGETGKVLPPLEGAESARVFERRGSFSTDGRLVALAGYRQIRGRNESFLTVWDSQSGKVVKSWSIQHATVAFHPSKPILAVLEPNEKKTRLGLWDFSAEVDEKK